MLKRFSSRTGLWVPSMLLPMSLAMALLFYSSTVVGEEQSRIWSDKNGKHEISARFIDVKDGKVRLERPNGDVTRVLIEKLSKEDQAYVRDAVKKQKQQAKEEAGLVVGNRVEVEHFGRWVPAAVVGIDYEWQQIEVRIDNDDFAFPRTKSLDEVRYRESKEQPTLVDPKLSAIAAIAKTALKVTPIDMSDAILLVDEGTDKDRVAADPAPPAPKSWKPRPVRWAVPSVMHSSKGPTDFSISRGEKPIAMVVFSTMGATENAPARIDLLDLSSRKKILSGSAPPGTKRVYLSPSGRRVITIPEEFHDPETTGQLDAWKIDGRTIEHWVSFAPYTSYSWPNQIVFWAAWLDDARLFTSNKEGKTILWQVEGAKAIYELNTRNNSSLALSPNRRQLAVGTNNGVQIYDSSSGDLLAVVGQGEWRNSQLAFSPSGRQLASVASGFVDVMDITTGETLRSFPCKTATGGDFWWIDEQLLFVGNSSIVDVSRRITIWEHTISSRLVKPAAGTQWTLAEMATNGSATLVPFDLSTQEMKAAAIDLSDEELLAVKPGDEVSVDVQIRRDNMLATEVRDALLSALAKAGMQVVEESDLKLIATMSHGKTQEVTYQMWGLFRRESETISVTDRVYTLLLQLNGVPIWKRESVVSSPHHIRLKEGETIREAVARVMKPRSQNFEGRLPAYVVKPEYSEPLGSSKMLLQLD